MVKVNVGHQTLDIWHQTSDIGHHTNTHRTSHSHTSDIRHRTSDIKYRTSYVKKQASTIGHHISDTGNRIGQQTSDIRYQPSDIRHRTSNIRHQTSDLGHQTSYIAASWLSKFQQPLATDTEVENCSSRCWLKLWDNCAQKWWFLTHLPLPTITILARKWPNNRCIFLLTNRTFDGLFSQSCGKIWKWSYELVS